MSRQITSNQSFKVYEDNCQCQIKTEWSHQELGSEYSRHIMEAAVLLPLSNLFIFSNLDPEINLHVHLPPEEGTSV